MTTTEHQLTTGLQRDSLLSQTEAARQYQLVAGVDQRHPIASATGAAQAIRFWEPVCWRWRGCQVTTVQWEYFLVC